MAILITRIEIAGPDSRARRLIFDDYSDPRTTSAAVVKQLALSTDAPIDRAELETSLCAAESTLARERALQLLGYRERSAYEVESKLRDNGYPAHVAKSVVTRFTESQLIDDVRFAQAWVRSRMAAGYGRRRIATELSRKGVDDGIALSALAEDLGAHTELQRARDSLRDRVPRDMRERQRLVRRLVSRGFDLRDALDAVPLPSGAPIDSPE